MVTDSATRFTQMHVFLFSESSIHCLHAWSFNLAYTQFFHAFKSSYVFNRPLAGLGNFGLDSALPEQHYAFLRGKALPSLQKMCKSSQTLSSRLSLCNSERQCLLAQKIVQCSPWACMTCWRKLRIVQSQHPVGQSGFHITQFQQSTSLLIVRISFCTVLVVSPLAS